VWDHHPCCFVHCSHLLVRNSVLTVLYFDRETVIMVHTLLWVFFSDNYERVEDERNRIKSTMSQLKRLTSSSCCEQQLKHFHVKRLGVKALCSYSKALTTVYTSIMSITKLCSSEGRHQHCAMSSVKSDVEWNIAVLAW